MNLSEPVLRSEFSLTVSTGTTALPPTTSTPPVSTPEVCEDTENMGPLSDNVEEVRKNETPLPKADLGKLQPGDAKKLSVSEGDTVTLVLKTPKEVDKISVAEPVNVKEVTVTLTDEEGNTVLVSVSKFDGFPSK